MVRTDESLKRKMTKDGSVAKYIYGQAGAGKGLNAAGIMLIFIGALLGIATSGSIGADKALILGGPLAVIGLLLVVFGIGRQKKRMDQWLSGFAKEHGLTEDEVRQLDQEFLGADTALFAFDKGTGADSLKFMGFMTPHFFRFAETGKIVRANELAVCFYANNYRYPDGGSGRAFMAYDHSMDEKQDFPFFKEHPNEQAAMEIVEAISKHYPSVITAYRFRYGDQEYDAARDVAKVIKLHKQLTGQER